MRNRKIYQQLETIIETSLSPKRGPALGTRLLCSPNVSLPSISNMKSLRENREVLKNEQKIKLANKNDLVDQIQRKKMLINSTMSAFQNRQRISSTLFSEIPEKEVKKDMKLGEMIHILSKSCLAFAKNYPQNRIVLEIVFLNARGRRKQAILKLIQWILEWVANLFKIFSSYLLKKALIQ